MRQTMSRRQFVATTALLGTGLLTGPARGQSLEKITYLFPAPPILPAFGPIRLAHAHFIKSGGSAGTHQLQRPSTDLEKVKAWGAWKHLSGDLIVENNVHVIDVLNWFLDGHPVSAVGSGGSTLPRHGDMRDHNFVAFEYGNGVQGQLSGATLAPNGYRDVVEQFFGRERRQPAGPIPVITRVASDYSSSPASGLRATWIELLAIHRQQQLFTFPGHRHRYRFSLTTNH